MTWGRSGVQRQPGRSRPPVRGELLGPLTVLLLALDRDREFEFERELKSAKQRRTLDRLEHGGHSITYWRNLFEILQPRRSEARCGVSSRVSVACPVTGL